MSPRHLTVHVPEFAGDIVSTGFDAAEAAGFDIDRDQEPDDDDWPYFNGNYDKTTVSFMFDVSSDRAPYERVLSVGLSDILFPSNWSNSQNHAEFVAAIINLACELASAYDAEYVSLFKTGSHNAIAPTGMPFADHIDQVPQLAVYSRSLLEELGGFDGLYGGEPWRYAELDSGHVLAMTADGPWQNPPFTDSERRDLKRGDADEERGLSDPFTALDPDEYGTDAVITTDDLAPEFTNEALTLERVYRDESDNLRRIDDDSFVRRLINDGPIGELPAGVDQDDERLSALIEGSIPPAFVQLDGPEDESVVSKTMALDIVTSKFDLLVSLARTARSADVSDDVMSTIEGILDELGEMDDQDGIDQYIEQKLL
ncbi:hypothetical protein [Haloarcula rubripromontorii]|uniref:Uncharacterized protein n=1 Tax=Haloarcula rubripromontorii TaxID=1705562 RepID=A0A0N0BNG6_9EURY|nr:hypothetical protein [Haloarcula rubripromontorii]KOX92424.1 hypothetical protein AMS69_13780 [Haloarcula rubripromontorii]